MRIGHLLPCALICLLVPAIASAQQFTIVLHPSFGLTADQVTLSERSIAAIPSSYTHAKPTFILGKSAKDAPDARGFILEMEEPKINRFSGVQTGSLPRETRQTSVPYKGVYAIMPYSFWHRSDAGDPVLL